MNETVVSRYFYFKSILVYFVWGEIIPQEAFVQKLMYN